MSIEHQPRPSDNHERSQAEVDAAAAERLEELKANPEQTTEHAETRAEAAREVINKYEEAPEPAPAETEAAEPAAPRFMAHLDRAVNYRDTMTSMRRHLSPVSRAFSKVVHAPIVEKISEPLEKTVMRPSLVAGATWSAAIVGLIFYLTARLYGFSLSGSEMLAALLAGAVLGLVIEGLTRGLRRR